MGTLDDISRKWINTNAYGRIDGNTLMLDRTSVGAEPGTSLISSGMTNVLGLPETSQTNIGDTTAVTGTIWDKITPTANSWEGTIIPYTFRIKLDDNIKTAIWCSRTQAIMLHSKQTGSSILSLYEDDIKTIGIQE